MPDTIPVHAIPGLTPLAAARAAHALERVRKFGGRRTPMRGAVLQVLAGASGHLSITEIHDRIEQSGLWGDRSGVHRTIGTYIELGLVHTLPLAGDAAYGLADPPHHHAICTYCGRVSEIAPDTLAGALVAAEHASGFDLQPTGLALHGVCPSCR